MEVAGLNVTERKKEINGVEWTLPLKISKILSASMKETKRSGMDSTIEDTKFLNEFIMELIILCLHRKEVQIKTVTRGKQAHTEHRCDPLYFHLTKFKKSILFI